MQSTLAKGNKLEDQIFKFFKMLIDNDQFWAKSENCKIFQKKEYFSKDRNSSIVFDVVIEIYLPNSDTYSQLVLIECKNYKNSVKVDDVEEFFSKVQQVAAANSKAIIATTHSFQRGARQYAKSKGIGLFRYFSDQEFKWELHRSSSLTSVSNKSLDLEIDRVLGEEDCKSRIYSFFMEFENNRTVSLWEFFDGFFCKKEFSNLIKLIRNKPPVLESVPYVSKAQLECKASELLRKINYTQGAVDLDRLSKCITGLQVQRHSPQNEEYNTLLGSVDFSSLVINIFETKDKSRDRFTLAHELSHVFLNHGEHLIRDCVESNDEFALEENLLLPKDIQILEFQANYLAASLLMPKENFILDFLEATRNMRVFNKGFGFLYLDYQPCNMNNYLHVIHRLMNVYSTSLTATHIRLMGLGLLNDARKVSAQVINNVAKAIVEKTALL